MGEPCPWQRVFLPGLHEEPIPAGRNAWRHDAGWCSISIGIFIATGTGEFYMEASGLTLTVSPNTRAADRGDGDGRVGRLRGRHSRRDDTGQRNNIFIGDIGDGSGLGILRVKIYRYRRVALPYRSRVG
jgi:hypothetical protein